MNTSSGLHDLLVRNDINPTWDAKKEIKEALGSGNHILSIRSNSLIMAGYEHLVGNGLFTFVNRSWISGKTTKSKNPDIIKSSNKQRDK